MKKALIVLLTIATLVLVFSCAVDGMTIDELLLKGQKSKKTVTPTYEGKEAWTNAGCALPTVTYKGASGTSYAASETAPTVSGKYVAVFTLDGKAIEVPFEL